MLTAADHALIDAARAIIRARARQDWHHVGAAMRTRGGAIYSAVHLEAYIGRAAVCAEAVALGMAIAAGDPDVEAIVAVNRAGEVVSPCGLCRELIADYAPQARVLVPAADGVAGCPIAELLPLKYTRADE